MFLIRRWYQRYAESSTFRNTGRPLCSAAPRFPLAARTQQAAAVYTNRFLEING